MLPWAIPKNNRSYDNGCGNDEAWKNKLILQLNEKDYQ